MAKQKLNAVKTVFLKTKDLVIDENYEVLDIIFVNTLYGRKVQLQLEKGLYFLPNTYGKEFDETETSFTPKSLSMTYKGNIPDTIIPNLEFRQTNDAQYDDDGDYDDDNNDLMINPYYNYNNKKNKK